MPKKSSDKAVLTESSDKKTHKEVTVEDVSDIQPPVKPTPTPLLPTEILGRPLENIAKPNIPQNSIPDQDMVTQNSV